MNDIISIRSKSRRCAQVIQSGAEKNWPRRDDDKALRQLRRWTSEKAKRHFNISAKLADAKNNGRAFRFRLKQNKNTLLNDREISFNLAFRKTTQLRLSRWFKRLELYFLHCHRHCSPALKSHLHALAKTKISSWRSSMIWGARTTAKQSISPDGIKSNQHQWT